MSGEIYSVVQHSPKLHCKSFTVLLILSNPDDNIDINENSHFIQTINKLIISMDEMPIRFMLYYYLIMNMIVFHKI